MFDNNGDGLLDEAELTFMIKLLVRLYQDNLTEGRPLTVEDVLQESLDDSVLVCAHTSSVLLSIVPFYVE